MKKNITIELEERNLEKLNLLLKLIILNNHIGDNVDFNTDFDMDQLRNNFMNQMIERVKINIEME